MLTSHSHTQVCVDVTNLITEMKLKALSTPCTSEHLAANQLFYFLLSLIKMANIATKACCLLDKVQFISITL